MATYAEIKSAIDVYLSGCSGMADVVAGFDGLIASVGALVGSEPAAELELRGWLSDHQYLGHPWIKQRTDRAAYAVLSAVTPPPSVGAGKSAYELAQESGFQGTLQEWLASL